MTPRERAIEAIGQHETATVILEALDAAGLAIVEKPQRKGAPDAPGWWWIKRAARRPLIIEVKIKEANGELIGRREEHWYYIARLIASDMEWAVGPLEVPAEGRCTL